MSASVGPERSSNGRNGRSWQSLDLGALMGPRTGRPGGSWYLIGLGGLMRDGHGRPGGRRTGHQLGPIQVRWEWAPLMGARSGCPCGSWQSCADGTTGRRELIGPWDWVSRRVLGLGQAWSTMAGRPGSQCSSIETCSPNVPIPEASSATSALASAAWRVRERSVVDASARSRWSTRCWTRR